MTRLVFIRHGITEWNREKRYCGHKDIPLSGEGKSQAKLLLKSLNKIRIDKIYCSNKKRAIQTARILFKHSRIIPDRNLREINFGVFEGLRYEEVMEKYADIYKKWIKDPFKNGIPKSERMKAFRKRIRNAMQNIICSNADKTIAVVCHGGVIGIFVNGLLKNKNFWSCVPAPASITMIDYEKGRLAIKKFNDTTHLKRSNG